MPKILITGNGFDRSFGLPTLYKHFIDIVKHISTYPDLNFTNTYGILGTDFLEIKKSYNEFEFNNTRIEQIKKLAETNLWFKFFCNEIGVETWIDFENKIEYLLDTILNALIKIKEKSEKISSDNYNNFNFNPKDISLKRTELHELLNFGIAKKTEGGSILLNNHYLVAKYDAFHDFDFSKISQHLNESLNDLKKLFNLYLETFVVPLYEKIKIKPDMDKFHLVDIHFTFNYTPTFLVIYNAKIMKSSPNTRYLHGMTDSSKNKIVLGIDKIPNKNIDTSAFIPFTKSFQAIHYDTEYQFLDSISIQDHERIEFYIYGHSLDSSDKEYINEIFDFQKEGEKERKGDIEIVVIYHDDRSKGNQISNLIKIRGHQEIKDWTRKGKLKFLKIGTQKLEMHLLKVTEVNDITATFS